MINPFTASPYKKSQRDKAIKEIQAGFAFLSKEYSNKGIVDAEMHKTILEFEDKLRRLKQSVKA